MIQLKSYRIASISTWLLIIVLLILPIFVDSQSTITIQRLTIFAYFTLEPVIFLNFLQFVPKVYLVTFADSPEILRNSVAFYNIL